MSQSKSFPEEDWWDEDQIDLVRDRSINWKLTTFKAVIGFWIVRNGQKILGKLSQHEKLPADAVIDENSWDHEHCELCYSTIMEGADKINEGYTDGSQWVCPECYSNYILPRL